MTPEDLRRGTEADLGSTDHRFDALLPPQMAVAAARIGVSKAHFDAVCLDDIKERVSDARRTS